MGHTIHTYRQLYLIIGVSIYLSIYIPVAAWADQRAARSARPIPRGWAILYTLIDSYIYIYIYVYIYTHRRWTI